MILPLMANGLALGVLAWKTFYDLVWNKRRFKKEADKNLLDAARAKRDRQDYSTVIAFIGIAIAHGILIVNLVADRNPQLFGRSEAEIEGRSIVVGDTYSSKIRGLERRIKKIEEHLFPRTGPTAPTSYRKKLQEVDERLKALQEKSANRDEDFEELVRIVATLREAIETESRVTKVMKAGRAGSR